MKTLGISILVAITLFGIFACTESTQVTSPTNSINDLNISNQAEMINFAYHPNMQEPTQMSMGKTTQLTEYEGCVEYPFMYGDYNIYNYYNGLQFSDPTGINTGWVQIENESTIYWAPVIMELPELAADISLELLDNENWEAWFTGSGYFRRIGTNIKFYDEEMAQIGEIETETNSNWQLYSFAASGNNIKYLKNVA